MRIYHTDDYASMSRMAANIISAQIIIKPNSILGLATGSTTIGIYTQLVEWYKMGDLDFSQISTVNLDEYKSLSPDNKQSYYYFMYNYLFRHINIKNEHVNIPNGLEDNTEKECARYDSIIEATGGIDIQLLGIGHNGHIGFNEPDVAFEKNTHCVDLQQSTIHANQRFFNNEGEVPRQAYTMGIKSIMQAKCILLVACGKDKADIMKKSFYGPVTPHIPASVLQLHNNVIIVGNKDALSLIV